MQLPEYLTVVSVQHWVGVVPGTGHFFAEKAPDQMLAALTAWVCSGRDWPPELMAPARVALAQGPVRRAMSSTAEGETDTSVTNGASSGR
jgi:hypothetical protein